MRAAPTTEPTTIPAIAPPERPLLPPVPVADDDDGLGLDVEEGNKGGRDVVDGRVTPGHILLTLDAAQHESVEFGELDAQ